jgi:asparagine synthase (glutamine-hydrolysing)
MCGIAGIYTYHESAPPVDEHELLRIREQMIHRGPDGAGLWVSPDRRVGLAHRRLSIIDLSEAGAQPMATADGRYRVTFNGEIYNYRELKKELEAKGYRFRSNSDTEVLLHLYAEHGADMVQWLRGMYAFGIWDEHKRELFLARDPFGIKPLYYADDGSTIRFASQVKALLCGDKIDTEPDPAGHVGFFVWGAVPEPFTLYRGISQLPAGTWCLVSSKGRSDRVQHFDLRKEILTAQEVRAAVSDSQKLRQLHEAIRDSVRRHLVSDVPVSSFLSAGLDSAMVTAVASELNAGPLSTVTLGFSEFAGTVDDETTLAKLTAQSLGVPHEVSWVKESDFREEMATILNRMDQPSMDGVNTYFVAKAAAKRGIKVALSGLGGDEILGSYPSFTQVPLLATTLRPFRAVPAFGVWMRRLLAPVLKGMISPKYASLLEYGGDLPGAYLLRRAHRLPWELDDLMDPQTVEEGWDRLQTHSRLSASIAGIQSDKTAISMLETAWYMRNQLLRDADWAGMAHSLEIRVPFVDIDLFRAALPLLAVDAAPNKAAIAAQVSPKLPKQILKREKTGFRVPVEFWLEHLPGSKVRGRGQRNWAVMVNPRPPRKARILALMTDAYGGHGGIAKFNRDLLGAVSGMPRCRGLTAFPRLMPNPHGPLPAGLTFDVSGLGGKFQYGWAILRHVLSGRSYGLIVCGHINLVPLAWLLSKIERAPWLLVVHGIDAWQPTRNWLTNRLIGDANRVISVSDVTRRRLMAWSGLPLERFALLPNSIDLATFAPRPKRADLARKYGIEGKTVIMTMGRLAGKERYKGFDEVIEALPAILKEEPLSVYLIVGDGDDRARLEGKVAQLGLTGRVIFAGFIPENEKVDCYALGDAYVMPSLGEGFGIVLLEAMACGVPTVASKLDGGREALVDGQLGTLVDPGNSEEIRAATLAALRRPRMRPPGLEYFSYENFTRRARALVEEVIAPLSVSP